MAMNPDYVPRTAGPGKAARRTDMAGNQPIRVPVGLPYGEAGKLRTAEQQIPLPGGAPGGPPPGGGSAGPPGGPAPSIGQTPTGLQNSDPNEVLTALAHPTNEPYNPLVPGAQKTPTQSLAFKVDALRYLSSLPWAGTEITTLFKQAQSELDQQAATARPLPGV